MNKKYVFITIYIFSTFIPIIYQMNDLVKGVWVTPVWFVFIMELLVGVKFIYEAWERGEQRLQMVAFYSLHFAFVYFYHRVVFYRDHVLTWITILGSLQLMKVAVTWSVLKEQEKKAILPDKSSYRTMMEMTSYTLRHLKHPRKVCDLRIVSVMLLFYWIVLGNTAAMGLSFWVQQGWAPLWIGVVYLLVLTYLSGRLYLYQLYSIPKFIIASLGGAAIYTLSICAGVTPINLFYIVSCMLPLFYTMCRVGHLKQLEENLERK